MAGVEEGQGVYHYASGQHYEGQFKAGKFSGVGVYRYPNGDRAILRGAWLTIGHASFDSELFEEAEAAIGPAYDIEQIFSDPQYQARNDIVSVEDDELGTMRMANAFPFLSETPGRVRHAGPRQGEHNAEVHDQKHAHG